MQKLSDKEKENALNEVRILASIKHPNIVAYKEAFIDEPSSSLWQVLIEADMCLSIIMEYVDNGDLFQQICDHQKNQTLFKEDDIWKMFIQVVRGLKCLHEIQIFHRDLKSANVFINKDGSTKLGDMNVSKVAKKGLLYTQTGTPYYASPEVWRDQPYDHKSDIWSLGCVLYEAITLKPPFRAEDMQGLYKKVLRGIYPKLSNHYSAELSSLVKSLIQVSPQLRPSCEKILDMPIVKKKSEKLFPEDCFFASQSSLLNTIRVPKNLLYLTDRLPKPNYEDQKRWNQDEEEKLRRKTHDAGSLLPDIKNQKAKNGQLPPKKQKKAQPIVKPAISKIKLDSQVSEVQQQEQMSENGNNISANRGTVHSLDEDRRSVISKSSKAHSMLKREGSNEIRTDDNVAASAIQNMKQIHNSPIVHQKKYTNQTNSTTNKKVNRLKSSEEEEQQNDPYDKDEFEKDDGGDKEEVVSIKGKPELSHSSPLQNLTTDTSSIQQAPQNYTKKNHYQYQYSHQQQEVNTTSKKNMAYINITGEGAKAVGPIGLKKAEKDLIMRRYKYNHQQDNMQRVALIYGNPNQQPISTNSPYTYKSSLEQYNSSPYINGLSNGGVNGNNLSGIVKRSKFMMDSNTSQDAMGIYSIKLPRIQSLGKNQASETKILPPIGPGGLVNNNMVAKPPYYQQYVLKPSKIRSINKPLLQGGIAGEKMVINSSNISGIENQQIYGVSSLGGSSIEGGREKQRITSLIKKNKKNVEKVQGGGLELNQS